MLNRKLSFVFFVLVFSLLSASLVFAKAELVGKYQRISGPLNSDYLGIARTEPAYQLIELALGRQELKLALHHFDIAVVKNHTPVCVLDIELFANKAKVLVLSGLQAGITGWVPLEWLSGEVQAAKLWQ